MDESPVDTRPHPSYLVREVWRALWIVLSAMERTWRFDIKKRLREDK